MGKMPWRIGACLATFLVVAGLAAAAPARDEDNAGQGAWLGVYTQELTSQLRDGLDFDHDGGVLVSRVVDGSPAERAGLRNGDIIVSFNSRSVGSPNDLAEMVRSAGAGEDVSLGIVRDGEDRTIRVRLGNRPESPQPEMEMPPVPHVPDLPNTPRAPEAPRAPRYQERGDRVPGPSMDMPAPGMRIIETGRGRLGVRVEPLNRDLADYFDVPDGRGVLVLEVLKDTPAERAGLRAGDVIVRVEDKPVYDTEDLVSALADREGRVSLDVVRRGDRHTVEAQLERTPRAMRFRQGDGTLGDRGPVIMRREIRRSQGDTGTDREEMRRQIEDLRRQIDELERRLQEDRN